MQYILDLKNVEEHQLHPDPLSPDLTLPPQILEAGYIPHLEDLQPGDLILTAPYSKFDALARGISYVGPGGDSPEHARWNHAAVYAGELFLTCEATREGVKLGNLLHALSGSMVRIRRGVTDGEFIERELGWRTAFYSVARLNQPYDYSHPLQLGRLAMRTGFTEYRQKPPKPRGESEETISTELFQDAYWRATGILMQNRLSREATPAFLSATPLLKDVRCRWRKLSW
ncbi:MAG: hypothetical protein K2X03_05890 [Bryobacteraceae bacterium]|nr:hypothetical protein [Bryobacteraceae bacterium]